MMKLVISLCVVWVLLTSAVCGAKTRHLKWRVEYVHWSPDGVDALVMAINGQFPGPTIRARAGDIIHVELTNNLHTEGVVIHWHGIRQIGTPWMDGTASISQCAVNPGETFIYRFKVDKAGTYFYHGHYGMQRSAGLYGSLIVDVAEGEKESFDYDGEFNILLSDWWHKNSHELEVDLASNPMRWIGEPQTLLINGRGQFNCSLSVSTAHYSNSSAGPCDLRGGEQYAPPILHVQPNRTYRLRIASVTSLASLNLAIKDHSMVLVEADGNYLTPFVTPNMDIYSGESYSILFTADQDPTENYWISVHVRGREPKTPPGLAILNYHPNSPSHAPHSPPSQPPPWNDYAHSKSFANNIRSRRKSPKPPPTADRTILLLNTQNYINGLTRWSINNISLSLPATPYLGSIKYGLAGAGAYDPKKPPEQFVADYDVMRPNPNPNSTVGSRAYVIDGLNATVDVVLQNANALKANVSEIHPWHLHGHDFWVLGYGEGRFEKRDVGRFNLENPPLRNTAVVFPFGWTAIRFVADNPGVWAFHCHIEPHLHMGMGVVFAEGLSTIRRMAVPDEGLGCGLTGKLRRRKGGKTGN